ncbi:MAG: glycosyltransferase family 39 protein [Verrucomicrobiota bacterium]
MKSATRNYILLLAGCVLFHLAGTWSLPLIDRDEPRFAEATREMIERSDYVVPYFNNQFRFDKPPFTYWAQAASYRIFGENDFAARFPSVIAAALVAVSIFAWGMRIGGDRVAWWAAIIFTLSLQTFIHAKAAVADMWLVLFMTLAFWAGHELLGSGLADSPDRKSKIENRKWWWIFYVSLAFAFLAKGPIGWIPLLPVGLTILFLREPGMASRFAFARGILLMLVIVSLWAVPALIRTHGEFFRVGIMHHVVERSISTMEGHGSNSLGMYLLLLPFYFVTVFLSFFPWSIKVPWLVRSLWRKREAGIADPGYNGKGRDQVDNYLIGGIAIVFVIFTLVKTKLPHYTLPAFPLLALLLARHWSRQQVTRFMGIAIAMALILVVTAFVMPPSIARSFPAYALFLESRDSLRPEMEFGAVEYNEPSLVWYFRSRVKGFMTPLNKRNAADFMSKEGPRFVILPTTLTETLFPNRPQTWKTFSTQGFNLARGKRVDLTLVLKPE